MATNPNDLTIDYRKVMSIPPSKRRELSESTIDILAGLLTPGQRVALFPDYFKKGLSELAGQRAEWITQPRQNQPIDETAIPAVDRRSVDDAVPTQETASQVPGPQMVDSGNLPGEPGLYRPVYNLSADDLSDAVINTIAGEALNNQASIDGVINNMLNRVGVEKNWTNLRGVARAPGQYAGYRKASKDQAEFIRARIKAIASGSVPSNIGTATEFRAEYYVKGAGYGKTFERKARAQGYLQPGKGDNVYATTFAPGPYAPYSKEQVAENMKKMGIDSQGDTQDPPKNKVASADNSEVITTPAIEPPSTYSLVDNAAASAGRSEKEQKMFTNEKIMGYIKGNWVKGARVNDSGQIEFTDRAAAETQLKQYGLDLNKIVKPYSAETTSTASMASGGILTEPHTAINNRTGERVNLGEVGTGGEAIVPLNKIKANEVGQQPYQRSEMQSPVDRSGYERITETINKDVAMNSGKMIASKNPTGQEYSQPVGININSPAIPPTARKAYADATLTPRINNFSSIGTQYRSFGI
jgi:hypothetical protein